MSPSLKVTGPLKVMWIKILQWHFVFPALQSLDSADVIIVVPSLGHEFTLQVFPLINSYLIVMGFYFYST